MHAIRNIGQGLFATAVLGALTLGATRALAQPAGNAAPAGACVFWDCMQECQSLGYDRGRCTSPINTQPTWCECYNL